MLSSLPLLFFFSSDLTKKENWQYVPTECDNDWLPHNGYCYHVTSEARNWQEAVQACDSQGANLTSLRTLSEVEILLNVLENCKPEDDTNETKKYMTM